ncbi:MAG: hypothetical protein HY207_04335 [Nitrospirae bacterium]|nr:hypothetical protein [Nitrospirota bacterium]
MQTEIYQMDTAEAPLSEMYHDWEHRAELVKHLGLSGQEKWLWALEKAKRIPFRPLTGQEQSVWEEYLPTRYVSQEEWSRSRRGGRGLRDYALDLIPVPVLDVWNHCVLAGYFESYEIWAADVDPVLVGRLGPLTFLLARWGESLRPFTEIQKLVHDFEEEARSVQSRRFRW